MNTVERIQTLLGHYNLPTSAEYVVYPGNLHAVLDRLDAAAGIRTHCPPTCRSSTCNHKTCMERLTVGARISHHETKTANPSYHFWLGEEG